MIDPQSQEFMMMVDHATQVFHMNYRRPQDADDEPERFRDAMWCALANALASDVARDDITGILQEAAAGMARKLVQYPGTPYTKEATESLTNTLNAIKVSMEVDNLRKTQEEVQEEATKDIEHYEKALSTIKDALTELNGLACSSLSYTEETGQLYEQALENLKRF